MKMKRAKLAGARFYTKHGLVCQRPLFGYVRSSNMEIAMVAAVDPPAINITLEVSGSLADPRFRYIYKPPAGTTTPKVDEDGTIHLEELGPESPVSITFTVSAPLEWGLNFYPKAKDALWVSKKNDPDHLREWNNGNRQFLAVVSSGTILALSYAGCTQMGIQKTPHHSYKLNLRDANGNKVAADPKIQNGAAVLRPGRNLKCAAET
jgi:hypothetical protein